MTHAKVNLLAREIVSREGGFVNDPDDPGGATKYGVTIHTMRHHRMDLDGDGDIDIDDVLKLTKEDAARVFVRHYFYRPKIDKLPEQLHDTVFDMCVNAGGNAVKILQRELTRLGFPCGKADGAIGPKTIAAARLAALAHPNTLRDYYGVARRNYYYALGDKRVRSRKYARRRDGGKGGWITRAEEFISPARHLTNAQHRQRIAKWGR